jgi:hypothetical protein
MPDWWKDVPVDKSKNHLDPNYMGTVKGCPSFPDYFSNGFIIPMWCDTLLKFNKEQNTYTWHTPDSSFSWSIHGAEQFLNHLDFKFLNSAVNIIFKAHCPWKIITEPGYSVYQMPLYYHDKSQFSVMPGIIDTDRHHTINQQVMLMTEEPIFIPRGTPFVQYIPFERKKYSAEVRQYTDKDLKRFNEQSANLITKFMGSSQYVKSRKNS